MEIYCVDKIFLLIVISIFKMTWTKHTFGCARLGKATLGSICDGKLVNNWFKSRLTIILVCSIIAHLTSLIIVFWVAAIRYQIVVCCWDPKLTRYMNMPLFHATPGLIGEFPLVFSWISPCFCEFPFVLCKSKLSRGSKWKWASYPGTGVSARPAKFSETHNCTGKDFHFPLITNKFKRQSSFEKMFRNKWAFSWMDKMTLK